MKHVEQVLRTHKIKVTPQRLAVYGVFDNGKCHLSAEEIFQRVRPHVPAISLGTVYSTLEHFTRKRLLQEVRIDLQKSLYERCDHDHHHFLCRACQTILDVDMPLCKTLQCKSVEGHQIESFQGYFYGLCQDCQAKNKSRTKR